MAVILVVDDNQKIRRLIDIYLRREGFSTLLAEKMLDREINMDDHREMIDSFIEEIGDAHDGDK